MREHLVFGLTVSVHRLASGVFEARATTARIVETNDVETVELPILRCSTFGEAMRETAKLIRIPVEEILQVYCDGT
jgi:hypothetical protein